jgi:hypothetical protein
VTVEENGFWRMLSWSLLLSLWRTAAEAIENWGKQLEPLNPPLAERLPGWRERGVIKEYTVIPDFVKLGYQIMAFTFFNLRKSLTPAEVLEARRIAKDDMRAAPSEMVIFQRGLGLEHDAVVVSFHKDYSDYLEFKKLSERYAFLDIGNTESFIVDLNDEVSYRSLTFANLAIHVLEQKKGLE